MATHDYIPANDSVFLTWVKILFDYVQAHAATWQIAPETWADITVQISAYDAAWTKAQQPNRGKGDTKAKDDARDALKKSVRQYVKEYLEYNHLITDEDRTDMGLPVHDTTRTPVSTPKTAPDTTTKSNAPATLEIQFRDAGSDSKAKPDGVHGAEFSWGVFDHVPTDASELTRSSFFTRTPAEFEFTDKERSLTFAFVVRWENNRGGKGPWSGIRWTVIP